MKDKYIDCYGTDSLPNLIACAKNGCNYFITVNEAMLKDRKELEKKFKLRIMSPQEFMKKKGEIKG